MNIIIAVFISLAAVATFAYGDMPLLFTGLKGIDANCYKSPDVSDKFCGQLSFKISEYMAQNHRLADSNSLQRSIAQLNAAIRGAMAAGPAATEILRSILGAEGKNAAELVINSINRSNNLHARLHEGEVQLRVTSNDPAAEQCDGKGPSTIEELIQSITDKLSMALFRYAASLSDASRATTPQSIALSKRDARAGSILLAVAGLLFVAAGIVYAMAGTIIMSVTMTASGSAILACSYLLWRNQSPRTEAISNTAAPATNV